MNLLVYFLMKQIFLIEFSVKNVALSFKKKKKKVLTSSPIQRMEVIHWKTNGIKTGWKCIASNLEELFSLGSIKGKQKQTDDISGAFYCIVQEN